MQTRLLPPGPENLELGRQFLLQDLPVAFPTETVYGLGADARSGQGVRAVFEAKGRPADNPLIVHLADPGQIGECAEWTPLGRTLARALMPGPVTLVLRKKPTVSPAVTAGLDTVGLRVPDHPVAHAFLQCCGFPVAAPSANTSSRPSPTTAEAVLEDLRGRIPLILDGGPCRVGIESSVIDVTGDRPVILRPGRVTAEDLAAFAEAETYELRPGESPRSPGLKYRHYAPACEAVLVRPERRELLEEAVRQAMQEGKRVGVLARPGFYAGEAPLFSLGQTVDDMARLLFFSLRAAEKESDLLFVEAPEDSGFGRAVLNRMRKACGGREL